MFPSIKELAILHPLYASREGFEVGITGLAESQYMLGVSFKRIMICMDDPLVGIALYMTTFIYFTLKISTVVGILILKGSKV